MFLKFLLINMDSNHKLNIEFQTFQFWFLQPSGLRLNSSFFYCVRSKNSHQITCSSAKRSLHLHCGCDSWDVQLITILIVISARRQKKVVEGTKWKRKNAIKVSSLMRIFIIPTSNLWSQKFRIECGSRQKKSNHCRFLLWRNIASSSDLLKQ